ncbi:unnamed protein product [Effrenium voratum]|nr:unnamed protein product [Effrenium voratum]
MEEYQMLIMFMLETAFRDSNPDQDRGVTVVLDVRHLSSVVWQACLSGFSDMARGIAMCSAALPMKASQVQLIEDEAGARAAHYAVGLILSKLSSKTRPRASDHVQQLIAKLIKVGKGIKGRHMIFMVLEIGVEHLYKLTYPGDKKMGDFKQRWLEIIAGIKEEKLRDALYRKLKGNSKELELDLKLYEHMERNDPAKTQKYLLNMIDRPTREENNWENKEKSLKDHKFG